MRHDEVAELTDLYVLGGCPSDEAAEVEAHLEECGICRAAVDHAWEVARLLRLGVPIAEPTPDLHTRVMGLVRDDVANARRAQIRLVNAPATGQRPGLVEIMKWAAAAAVVPLLLAGWLTYQMAALRQQVEITELALSRSAQSSQAVTEVMARAGQPGGGMIRVQATEMAPAAMGTLYFVRNESQGVLVVEGLPPLPPGEEYRCWLMSGEKPMGGGALHLEQDGSGMVVIQSPMPLDSVDMLRVTNEPLGGEGPKGKGYLWARIRGA